MNGLTGDVELKDSSVTAAGHPVGK